MDSKEITPGDVWEKMGALEEMEVMPVLTNIFVNYEQQLQNDPGSIEAKRFFRVLNQAIDLASECNLNRR